MNQVYLTRASWLLAGISLFMVLWLHLLAALLAGLLVFELVHLTAPMLANRLSDQRARLVVAILFAGIAVGLVALLIGISLSYFTDSGRLAVLATKMAEILESSRGSLPLWVQGYIPGSLDDLKTTFIGWLRNNAAALQVIGKEAGRSLAHILIGLVVGAMIAVQVTVREHNGGPLVLVLRERANCLARAFRNIVFAQVRISAINTLFTGLYLAVVLPLFGVQLPLVKTMIAITFVVGLLPVIGNLISNTVIVVVSLAHSPQTAMASLAFLVIIHKLEYFLNARIVGEQIAARAWELLLAMLVMEAAFGLPGVVAAPIFYAYLKAELRATGLV